MIHRECTQCEEQAVLQDAEKASDGRFRRTYKCPNGHESALVNNEPGEVPDAKGSDEPASHLENLKRLNAALDRVEARLNAEA